MSPRMSALAFAGIMLTAGVADSHAAADPTPNGPEIIGLSVGNLTVGFQSRTIFHTTPRLGWPHTLTRPELRSVATGVRMAHTRIRAARGFPRAHRAVCEVQRGYVGCRVLDRKGRAVAWYPVRRIFEDGSVSVWLPLPASSSIELG